MHCTVIIASDSAPFFLASLAILGWRPDMEGYTLNTIESSII